MKHILMKRKIKIIFIRPYKSTFIQKDLELLKNHFEIKEIDFVYSGKDLKTKIFNLFNMAIGISWADLIFVWFADTHTFWAIRISKMFRKKSVVVVGGYEVAKIPEIKYGAMLNPKSALIVEYVLGNADKVLTVDDGLKKDAMENVGVSGENIFTVPTGYDYDIFKPNGTKDNLIISVSAGDIWERVRLKGIDTFVKSAKFMPNTKFLVIGIQGDALKKLKDIASPNVNFINQIPQEAIIQYYQKANVYCQLSMREGLPNALCEAMLCECVPVGTDVQGVRTAIGDAGFYVPYGDPKATAEAINIAMKSEKGKDARKRIKDLFPIERREKKLVQTIREVIQNE